MRTVVDAISDRSVPAQASFEHTGEHRYVMVNIVVDTNLGFVGVQAVKSAGVLNQSAFPRHGQDQKKCVQPRVVKPVPGESLGRLASRMFEMVQRNSLNFNIFFHGV
jgi:hypothetical protein